MSGATPASGERNGRDKTAAAFCERCCRVWAAAKEARDANPSTDRCNCGLGAFGFVESAPLKAAEAADCAELMCR